MTELVVRLVGGVHALFGITLFAAAVSALTDDAPDTVLGWVVVVLGAGLVAAMIGTGIRIGLGEPVRPSRAGLMISATLIGGLTGALWIALVAGDFGR